MFVSYGLHETNLFKRKFFTKYNKTEGINLEKSNPIIIIHLIKNFIFLYNPHISLLNQADIAYFMSGNKATSYNLNSPKVSGDNMTLEWYRTWGRQENEVCGEEAEYNMNIMTVDSSDNVYVIGTNESF